MKITIYELLGMIKDGKAPIEIKYNDYLLSWDNVDKDYYCEEYGNLFEYLFCEFQTIELLNFTVEILEEENKIPEKLDIYDELQSLLKDNNIDKHNLHKMLKKLELKQNEIIDYLKNKGE